MAGASWWAPLVVLGITLVQLSAGADESSFEFALDTDDDASTGCATDLGDLQSPNVQPGFEARLDVVIDASFSPPRVGAIELVRCLSGAWAEGAAESISSGGWDAAVDAGQLGGDAIEAFVPLADLGLPTEMRLALRTSSLSGEVDVLDSQASVPIVLALSAAVPALGPLALLLLASALLLSSLWLRQHPAVRVAVVLLATGVAAHAVQAAVVTWDGDLSDWASIPALATDPIDDVADADGDLIALYAQDVDGMLIFRTDLRNLEVSACEFDAGSTPNPSACSCGSTVCAASSSCDASGSACDFLGGSCPPPPTWGCFDLFPSASVSNPCNTPECAGCPDSCANESICNSALVAHCAAHPLDPGCFPNVCRSLFPSVGTSNPCDTPGCAGCPDSCADRHACNAATAAHCTTFPADPGCSSTVEVTCLENFPSGDPSASHHPCSSSWVGCPDSCEDQAGYDAALVSHCSLHEIDLGCASTAKLVAVANVESACYSGCGDTLCATSTFPSGDPLSGSHPCNEPGCQGCPDSCANQASCDIAIAAHCALYGADLGCQPGGELCTTAVPE